MHLPAATSEERAVGMAAFDHRSFHLGSHLKSALAWGLAMGLTSAWSEGQS